jgi:DNA-binding NarL/FixJ family response regulator
MLEKIYPKNQPSFEFLPNKFCLEENIDLTTQEIKILDLALCNLSNKEIAETLFVSELTVKKHRTNIYKKVQINGKSQVRKFLRKITLSNSAS